MTSPTIIELLNDRMVEILKDHIEIRVMVEAVEVDQDQASLSIWEQLQDDIEWVL